MAEGGPVIFREMRPDESDAYEAFLRRCLPNAERVIEMNHWRRDDPAGSGGVIVTVGVLEGEIVAAMSVGPNRLTRAGESVTCGWKLDTIVDPEKRGLGLGKKLTLATAAPWPIAMAKGTQPKMYLLRRSVGFRDVRPWTVLARPVTAGGGHSARAMVARAASLLLNAVFTPLRLGRRDGSLRFASVDGFDADFDVLEQRLARTASIRQQKGVAYLTWRYTTCPGREYDIYRVDDAKTLRGAAVVRWPRPAVGGAPDVEPAWLVDLIVDEGDHAAAGALLSGVLAEAKRRRAPSLRVFATSRPLRRTLLAHGFVDTRHTPRFTYITGAGDPGWDWAGSNWNFWHGDADTELY